MPILNDSEKVSALVKMLNKHIEKIKGVTEENIVYFFESIRTFLTTQNAAYQRAAYSKANLFLNNVLQQDTFRTKKAIGALISAYDHTEVIDAEKLITLIESFENQLKSLTISDAENIYKQRWEQPDNYIKVVSGKVERRLPTFLKKKKT